MNDPHAESSNDRRFDVLVVGAGHAGVQVVAHLAPSFEGTVGLLSAENCEPYERPPLTKGFLLGDVAEPDLLLRPTSFWEKSGITLLLGQQVTGLDSDRHEVVTSAGRRFSYGTLVWAAGAEPLRPDISGMDLAGVHQLRTLSDTRGLRQEIQTGTRVVVIGGGYIGLEGASACVRLGAEVTVVEARERLLARVTGPEVAEYVLHEHLHQGARVELESVVTAISGNDGRVMSVHLGDGREIPADVVLVSIGIRPTVAVLAAAGARCSNGVEIDPQGRTGLPDVYAVGDCTCFPVAGGDRVRLESLQNAVEQGEVVARAILGEDVAYEVKPYFWSHQYDINIKTIGLFSGYDETIVRQDDQRGSFSVIYLRGGRVCAVDSINAMKDYVDARRLLGAQVVAEVVRDPTARLRDAVVDTRSATVDTP